ncbi:signal peptidase I [Paenibacillus oenotherae]|uniref:Signal peptidase I n=1 Tax=Paenibacillus oenotherae TaxID=1435645 RepID=A0ABS7D0N2_9BACL|nr:signal peptidase I [Paenibacillus oenotherae]MBW7473321.1 signal peptidase I [Paenibacillus oenotherae]
MDQQQRPNEEANELEKGHEDNSAHEANGSRSEAVAEGTPSGGGRAQKEIFEWVKALAIAALLVIVIRYFLFAPFIVDGPSMETNFYTGERIIVNKLIYDIREPKRGEVLVFHVPDQGRDFIKRVIGVPGDKVKYEGDNLYINGKKVEEPYLKESLDAAKAKGEIFNTEANFPNEKVQSDTVPEGTVLAFGDNRRNSQDSRAIGFISMDEIVGRADVVFWPLKDITFVKHE